MLTYLVDAADYLATLVALCVELDGLLGAREPGLHSTDCALGIATIEIFRSELVSCLDLLQIVNAQIYVPQARLQGVRNLALLHQSEVLEQCDARENERHQSDESPRDLLHHRQ
jgi:hypothetical protein